MTALTAATRIRVLVVRIRARSHPPGLRRGSVERNATYFAAHAATPCRGRPGRYCTPQTSLPGAPGHETARGTSRWCRTSPNDITDPPLGPSGQGTATDHHTQWKYATFIFFADLPALY